MSSGIMTPLMTPLMLPLMQSLDGRLERTRKVYQFDGSDDYGQFAQPVQLVGDFQTSMMINCPFTQASQANFISGSGWRLQAGGTNSVPGQIGFLISGSVAVWAQTISSNVATKLTFSRVGGVFFTAINDGQPVRLGSVLVDNRDLFVSHVGFNNSGIGGNDRLLGQFYDLRINGQLYPINNPASNIQTSVPDNGNPLTLFNTNPERWSKIPCPKPEPLGGVFTSDGLQVFTSDNLAV